MPAFVVYSDFDGTITVKDTGVVIIDTFMGSAERARLDAAILDGSITQRQAFDAMWGSVQLESFDDAVAICTAHNISHDPAFRRFYSILQKHGVTLKVVSSGIKPIVELYLKDFDNIQIFANECNIIKSEDGKIHWTLTYVDNSPFGHDKGAPIRKLKEDFRKNGVPDEDRPKIIFIGDGVSDLSAARDADVVFAKKGKDLATYCEREGISGVILWEDFGTICDWIETKMIQNKQ